MGNGVSTTDLILASGRIDREHVPADDREWNVFFEAPSTMESICSTIHPADIRQMRYRQPRNLATLISKSIKEMQTASASMEPESFPRAMAACRILTRIIPVVLEADDETDEFASRVLWDGATPLGWLNAEEAVRVGLDPKGPEPYGPSDADEGDAVTGEELEARAAEREKAMDEAGWSRTDAPHTEHDDDDQEEDEAEDEDDDDDDEDDDDDDGEEEEEEEEDAAAAGVGSAEEEEEEEDGEQEAEEEEEEDELQQALPDTVAVAGVILKNPSEGVAKVLKRVSKGELPRGFRRAQKVADLKQAPPKLRWTEPADGTVSPGRGLCHAVMRLLFAPSLSIDKQSYGFFHNKRRVLRERADMLDDAALGGAASDGSAGRAKQQLLDESNAVWPTLLWASGVGFKEASVQASGSMIETRIELLRLVVSLLSKPLFADTDAEIQTVDRFADCLTARDCPFAPTLTLSLLNTILAFDPVGLNGYIPYASTMLADSSSQLTDASLQALLLLLHHSPGARPRASVAPPPASLHHEPIFASSDPFSDARTGRGVHAEEPVAESAAVAEPAAVAEASPTAAEAAAAASASGRGEPTTVQAAASHSSDAASLSRAASGEVLSVDVVGVHRAMLASVRHEKDLHLIFTKLTALLNAVWQSDAAYFPGSTASPVLCQQEIIALMYYLLCDNPNFLTHVVRDADANALVAPLCYFLWTGRLAPARSQFLHLATFTLFLLSGYRDFAVGLNTKIEVTLPGGIPVVSGVSTHADLLVLTLHRLVVNATKRLRPLYGHFLATLSNVSPYIKHLSLDSSVRLGALLDILASPRFLFARPDNFALLAHLVTTLANIMQYQFVGNEETMYALVRAENRLEWLSTVSHTDAEHGHASAVKQAESRDADKTGIVPPAADSKDMSTPEADAAEPDAAAAGEESASEEASAAATTSAVPAPAVASPLAAASEDGQEAAGADEDEGVPGRADDIVWAAWRPTKAWLAEQMETMPLLHTLLSGTRYMSTILRRECDRKLLEGVTPDDEVLIATLRRSTLVGVIPRPHTLYTRRSEQTQATWKWLSTFVWGVIFLRGVNQLPLFDTRGIKLFHLQIV